MGVIGLGLGLRPSFVFFLVCLMLPTRAWSFDIGDWLKNPPYTKGGTVQEQLHCYALPFGGIGFASHILTYVTVLCLAKGVNPMVPCKQLQHRTFNIILSVAGLLITLPLTVLTMVRCRNSWQFILIAVWKLVFSVTLSSMAIHAAWLINPQMRKLRQAKYTTINGVAFVDGAAMSKEDLSLASQQLNKAFRKILYWSVLYFPAAIVGFVGVMDLVVHNISGNRTLQTVSYIFGGVGIGSVLVVALVAFIFTWSGPSENFFASLFGSSVIGVAFGFFVLTVLSALYADWVLGCIAGNFVGVPSSDIQVLYWVYFAAKRLPMFSL
jgi:hypothetical protein